MNKKIQIPAFLSLEGKTAVVSGGASGIGLAIVKLLHEMGAETIILDKSNSRKGSTVGKLRKRGSEIPSVHCDVSKWTDCQTAVKTILQKTGRIDVLVNNAGVIIRKDIVAMPEEEWNHVLDVNLKGVYLLSRSIVPHMVERGAGSIIHIASGWGLKGGPQSAAYCAAKAGVVNLTRAMAVDHGPQGIRVNCVCPGDTDTPLLRSEAEQLGIEESRFLAGASERPLGRIGRPDDVARAVLFFASDMSSWVTGATLVVDGGGLA